MPRPRLTMVVLTWNEERNVGRCLASLARQDRHDFEVVVVDAASTDGTARHVTSAMASFPVPLRLEVLPSRAPIGEARNIGVSRARTDQVAFLSADAEVGPDWVGRAIASLDRADMVFGMQVHRPHAWTFGAAVRGLRYHFPRTPVPDPVLYASNVAAAYRKDLLVRFPFHPSADAAEDQLIARRAIASGARVRYEPAMVVFHHDVDGARQELVKSVREGHGCGRHADELGLMTPLLAWGLALVAASTVVVVRPAPWSVGLLAACLWTPAFRRAYRRRRDMRVPHILKGVLVSPLFDLVFLFHYLRGLVAARSASRRASVSQEIQP